MRGPQPRTRCVRERGSDEAGEIAHGYYSVEDGAVVLKDQNRKHIASQVLRNLFYESATRRSTRNSYRLFLSERFFLISPALFNVIHSAFLGRTSKRDGTMTPASEIISQLAYRLVALGYRLAHLSPIDGTGSQDNGTIQYKKSTARLRLTVLA